IRIDVGEAPLRWGLSSCLAGAMLLLRNEAEHEIENGRQEDGRLLRVHEDPPEVLILLGGEAPEPGRRDVVVVERRRGERECETEEDRADEGSRQVADPDRDRDVVRSVREHGPPENEPTPEEKGVL